MPTIRATSLRLNLDKPEHRQAWDCLQALDGTEFKSYTSAIVTAVNDYFSRYFRRKDDPYLETREREEKFIAEIVAAVERSAEKALPAFLAACIADNISDEEILEFMGVMSDGLPTLAGLMTFSKYPQGYFPQLCITAVRVPGLEMGTTGDSGNASSTTSALQVQYPICLKKLSISSAVTAVRKQLLMTAVNVPIEANIL